MTNRHGMMIFAALFSAWFFAFGFSLGGWPLGIFLAGHGLIFVLLGMEAE